MFNRHNIHSYYDSIFCPLKHDSWVIFTLGKSLQDAALESIKAGLKDQKKISPRRSLPDKKRPINYTRGVYRPNPVTWRGSTGSRSASTGGRYEHTHVLPG